MNASHTVQHSTQHFELRFRSLFNESHDSAHLSPSFRRWLECSERAKLIEAEIERIAGESCPRHPPNDHSTGPRRLTRGVLSQSATVARACWAAADPQLSQCIHSALHAAANHWQKVCARAIALRSPS